MTAQISDRYKYKGKEYSLVAISEEIEFNPQEYGLIPSPSCSACWRGYWCDYEVKDDFLELQNLYIHTKEGEYPNLEGVEVTPSKSFLQYWGHNKYADIGLPINYTGKILLGNDFIRKYYVHMGFQNAYAYKELIEFEFEDGELVNTIDHSEEAEKMREKYDMIRSDVSYMDEEDVYKFVEDSFSTDYSVKAWWLDE